MGKGRPRQTRCGALERDVLRMNIPWASRISALLQVAVDDDQMLTSNVCTKCTLGLVALEKAEIDLHAFKQQTLSSLIALQSS